jgi:hypothetical protein
MGAGKKGRNNDLSGVGPIRSLTILLYQNVGLVCHCCILVDISVQSVVMPKVAVPKVAAPKRRFGLSLL